MPHVDISEFDEASVELPFTKSQTSSKKYFLVRLPADVDVSLLNGKTVNLNDFAKSATSILGVDRADEHFELRRDIVPIHTTTRCLVQQDQEVRLGPVFSGSLTLARAVNTSVPKQDDKNIIDTYCKIDQLTGLTVRSLPFGSRTSLSELQERLSAEVSVKAPKKRAHKEEDSHPKDAVASIVDVEKKKKAKKKKGEQ